MHTHLVIGTLCAVLGTAVVASAHAAPADLPAGPIRDRHVLMEGIGKQAKIIGDAMKAGNTAPVAAAADQIQTDAGKILGLFPPGSTDPKSRAKADIWTNWVDYTALVTRLQTHAGALAAAARAHGDVKGAADAMFGACKSCHDKFREPEKQKGH